MALLEPPQAKPDGFENMLTEINNGPSYAGLVKSETNTELVLNSPEDGVMTLKKGDIKTRQRGLSATPRNSPLTSAYGSCAALIEFLATS